jgi:hypothetical protein
MQPLGIRDSEWSIGYGQSYETDGMNVYANWGGAAFTARATAKLGLLMLQHGKWNDRQLIAREWVNRALVYAGTPIAHGPLDQDGTGFGPLLVGQYEWRMERRSGRTHSEAREPAIRCCWLLRPTQRVLISYRTPASF